jgi:uncharacterized protein YdaU (DUF1376 family)
MIWYKFHLGDYIAHTTHLSDAEDLAYRRLLDLYYMSERPLPLDRAAVARKIRLDLDITESVLGEFFEATDEGYRNHRCDVEIAKYRHQVATNAASGKRGGRPQKTESVPKRNRNETLTDTDTDTEKEKNNPPKPPLSAAPTRFDEFWKVWPKSSRKVARAACEARWVSKKLDSVCDQILAHVSRMKTTSQWLGGYEPAPLTYLNQRRWEDDPEALGQRRVI